MKVERKNICKNLPKKGFEVEEAHHIYFHYHYDGKDTGVYTYISHSTKHKDYSGRLMTEIRKQLRLDSNQDVVDLVNCPMDEETYQRILREKGFLPEE